MTDTALAISYVIFSACIGFASWEMWETNKPNVLSIFFHANQRNVVSLVVTLLLSCLLLFVGWYCSVTSNSVTALMFALVIEFSFVNQGLEYYRSRFMYDSDLQRTYHEF